MSKAPGKTHDFADGCDFRPRGVVCKDAVHDCARCGWFYPEEMRRKDKIRQQATGSRPE